MRRGDLDLRHCDDCGFVGNVAFDGSLLSYGAGYENTQTASPAFDRYVDHLVDRLVGDGVRQKHVVEVGCGKGFFLERLCVRGDNRGTGFDPSYVGPASSLDSRVRFERRLFEPALAPSADVAVCRHVIEHVDEPVRFLRSIRAALADSSASLVYFEMPSLEWILRGTVLWDFFYEHCSYFTEAALRNAFRLAGFRPVQLERIFGGQYLLIKAEVADDDAPVEKPSDTEYRLLEDYGHNESRHRANWDARLQDLRANGPVGVWGAGAKGITFVNLVDPEATRVECLLDINPSKQGHFAPGTGHPIVGLPDARAGTLSTAIVMNPNYLLEARQMTGDAGLALELFPAV